MTTQRSVTQIDNKISRLISNKRMRIGINFRNMKHFQTLMILLLSSSFIEGRLKSRDFNTLDDYYYNKTDSSNGAFVQIPHSNPPSVRPPPYSISETSCPPMNVRENWIDTLCGDLNSGYVPQNPLGHTFSDGGTYPFDIIKNKTLEFFRRALPILKKDKSLPKVARYSSNDFQPPSTKQRYRVKRGLATRESNLPTPLLDAYFPDIVYPDGPLTSPRRRRQHGPGHNRFCDNTALNYYNNRLCKIYNAMWGKAPHSIQREASMENRHYHPSPLKHPHRIHSSRPSIDVAVIEHTKSGKNLNTSPLNQNQFEMPPTPCPSSAEYLTPVFARNHEGAWRYVVQIPKEGYFTQTVEVTKCLKSTCFYMDGSCKTSPRWQSLLVAELYYPDTSFPTTPKSTLREFDKSIESYKGNDVSISKSKTDPSQCDGFDKIGCYQVRLFYDWFLIPGSCKCWKRQFDFYKSRR